MTTANESLGYTVYPLAECKDVTAETGARLARIIRKASAKDSNGKESQGVFVPAITCADDYYADTVVQDAIVGFLHDVQDKMIRAITDRGRNIITDSDIDVQAMREWLQENDDSVGRISKDKIGKWFDDEVAPQLVLAFSEKLGVGADAEPSPEQVHKIEQSLNQYKDCFGMLAGRSPSVPQHIGSNLRKALDMVPATAFATRLATVLDDAMKEKTMDMLGL